MKLYNTRTMGSAPLDFNFPFYGFYTPLFHGPPEDRKLIFSTGSFSKLEFNILSNKKMCNEWTYTNKI